MKLGTQTGSLVNHIMTNVKETQLPKVGDGATVYLWSDRKPYTVIEVDEEKKIVTIQEDYSIRSDKNGMSEEQDYEFQRNPDGSIAYYKLTKNGYVGIYKNKETGRWNKSSTQRGVRFGFRDRYYDYSF